jgi:hypothetical protein
VGVRSAEGVMVTVINGDASSPLEPPELCGLDWGIDSVGSTRLAFALIRHAVGLAEANAFFRDLAEEVVWNLDDSWELGVVEVGRIVVGYMDSC